MTHHVADTSEDRDLTHEERSLLEWLLQHGYSDAERMLPHLAGARVVRRCGCGCASVDFSVDGREPRRGSGLKVLSDHCWRSARGNLMGVFAFARDGQLAGLEVWSIDGLETPSQLPRAEELVPIERAADA